MTAANIVASALSCSTGLSYFFLKDFEAIVKPSEFEPSSVVKEIRCRRILVLIGQNKQI